MVYATILTIIMCLFFHFFLYVAIDEQSVMIGVLAVLCLVAIVSINFACYNDGFNAYRSVCSECGYVCTDEEFTNCPKDGHKLIVAWEGEKDE